MDILDRQKGCFYGLAIGDALGAAIEFSSPGTFVPVTEYRNGGPFNLEAGEWTDDTSMALALADALTGEFLLKRQLDNYLKWYHSGKYSVNGICFDIGHTTRQALNMYLRTGLEINNNDRRWSGNGSIMRLAPIPIKYYNDKFLNVYASMSSETTHASRECVSACVYLANILAGLIRGESKDTVLDPEWEHTKILGLDVNIRNIANGSFKTDKEIKGSGYVVESLEAALWAFWSGSSFRDVVLRAVNLGDDSDTTGAIAGQLAGACYGFSNIPQELIDGLAKKDMIDRYLNPILEKAEEIRNEEHAGQKN